jgi:hypothetical protein
VWVPSSLNWCLLVAGQPMQREVDEVGQLLNGGRAVFDAGEPGA